MLCNSCLVLVEPGPSCLLHKECSQYAEFFHVIQDLHISIYFSVYVCEIAGQYVFLHLPKTKLVCLGARIHQALKSESATIKMLG